MFQLCDETAMIPKRQTSGSAGYDLHAHVDVELPADGLPHEINTGIRVAIPSNQVGYIHARSGLAVTHRVCPMHVAVIDSDYRGVLKVFLINHGSDRFIIKKGDRIAQLVLHSINIQPPIVSSLTLPITERSEGGFGSTGGLSDQQ